MFLITIWHFVCQHSSRMHCTSAHKAQAKSFKRHEINTDARDTQRLESRIFSRSILNELYYQLNNKTDQCANRLLSQISTVTIRRNEQTFSIYRQYCIMMQDQRSRDCAISIETARHFSFLSFLYWRSTRRKEKRTAISRRLNS